MPRKTIESFQAGPLLFSYPANWRREVSDDDDMCSVFLQSPGVTFALVGVCPDEDPQDMIDQAIETLREEHPGLECEDAEFEAGPGIEAVFFSIDVLSYCWVRSWRMHDSTIIVFMQTIEQESRGNREVFEAICRSVVEAPVA